MLKAMLHAARKAIPKGSRAKEVPWWNYSVEAAILERRKAWSRFNRDPNAQNASRLKQQ